MRLHHPTSRKEKVQIILTKMFRSEPFSIMLDVSDSIFETGLHSAIALFQISAFSINTSFAILVKHVNIVMAHTQAYIPFHNCKNDTNESSNYFTTPNSSVIHQRHQHNNSNLNNTNILPLLPTSLVNEKMLRTLNRHNSTARVISYMEREDDSLTEDARKRVQKMMHYEVPLRPFVATVMVAIPSSSNVSPITNSTANNANEGLLFSNHPFQRNVSMHIFPSSSDNHHTSLRSLVHQEHHERTTSTNNNNNADVNNNGASHVPSSSTTTGPTSNYINNYANNGSMVTSSDESPFMMCTPKSFPPTPSSRKLVIAQSTQFAEDVVFFARDQLRVEGAMGSSNARTRAMARALQEGSRLAVFNNHQANVHLTCGQHCATKISSSALYCSVRSMIPILRNCYVYFEMTVLPPPANYHSPLPSLAIGYSTLDMPLHNLVGAWESSAGICTHGQILASSQWVSPVDTLLSSSPYPQHNNHYCSYGNNSTVGCLALLDDYGCWDNNNADDGCQQRMATLSMTFNVNNRVVTLPLCGVAPIGSTNDHVPSSSTLYPGNRNISTGNGEVHRQQQQPTTASVRSSFQRTQPINDTLQILVPRQDEIFPTLTLHSSSTQVLCRFSSEDICATQRASIGAPEGVTVYAVDGSVLFEESVNSSGSSSTPNLQSFKSSSSSTNIGSTPSCCRDEDEYSSCSSSSTGSSLFDENDDHHFIDRSNDYDTPMSTQVRL